jgi:hypothetical protein
MDRLDRATRSGTEVSGNLAMDTRSSGIKLEYRTGPGGPVNPPVKPGEGHDDEGQESRVKRAGMTRRFAHNDDEYARLQTTLLRHHTQNGTRPIDVRPAVKRLRNGTKPRRMNPLAQPVKLLKT